MKKSALHQFKIDKNTIEHIIEGSIVINSIELMLEIIDKFADQPELV